jgi:hypothetical protein
MIRGYCFNNLFEFVTKPAPPDPTHEGHPSPLLNLFYGCMSLIFFIWNHFEMILRFLCRGICGPVFD